MNHILENSDDSDRPSPQVALHQIAVAHYFSHALHLAAELGIADHIGDGARSGSESGFARFNGTAPISASSGEGAGEPVRHRLDQGGNRQVNAVLHRMAVKRLRCHPPARELYERARSRGHTKREAMRILKRHLSNAVYRTMLQDTHRTGHAEELREAA